MQIYKNSTIQITLLKAGSDGCFCVYSADLQFCGLTCCQLLYEGIGREDFQREKVRSPVMSYRGRSYILSPVYIEHHPKYILA